jgi:hypothetical protein
MVKTYHIDGVRMHAFERMHLTIDGQPWQIVSTSITGPSWADAVHRVKNLKTREWKHYTVRELINLVKDSEQ